ncbi:MAG: DUF4389 domain-containing protein [Candidatus Limnocylindrales bacterium]
MAYAPAPAAPDFSGYPIQLTVTQEREINRLWGIPFVGMVVRGIMAIPHFVVLWALGIVLGFWMFLGWIPILFLGRVPGIVVTLLTEYIQRGARVGGYVGFLMPGGYPPLEPGAPTPIDVRFNFQDLRMNQLWGIPLLGWLVRVLVLIPHIIVLALAAILIGLSLLVLWIPILLLGTYPGWAASLYGGFMRYVVRVQAYGLLLPVPYPPFSFS